MEVRPNQKYDSGFSFRDVLTEYSQIPARIDSVFPRCTTRTKSDMPLHNSATYSTSPEWSDSVRLDMPGALLEAGGREHDLTELLSKAIAALEDRLKLAMSIPEFLRANAEVQRLLESRLAMLEKVSTPSKAPAFGGDAQLVLLEKLDPNLLRSLKPDWEYLTSVGDGSWPDPFGNVASISTYVNRSAMTTNIYEKWTNFRAAGWKDLKLSYSRSYASFMDVDRSALDAASKAIKVSASDLTFGPAFPLSKTNSIQGLFRLNGGAKPFLEHKYVAGERGRDADILLKVESVKHIDRDSNGAGPFLVWTVTVLY
jgi:hypothetical protein